MMDDFPKPNTKNPISSRNRIFKFVYLSLFIFVSGMRDDFPKPNTKNPISSRNRIFKFVYLSLFRE